MSETKLREEVELQLEELLENRPNEEKEPRRRRNRKKDIIKDALRGNQRLKYILLDEKVEELKREREVRLDEEEVLLRLVREDDDVIVENLYNMMSREEIERYYKGYSVTQNKRVRDYGESEKGNEWLDVCVELKAKRRVWGVDIIKQGDLIIPRRSIFGDLNKIGLVSKELTLANMEDTVYTLKEFKEAIRPYLHEEVYDIFIGDIEKLLRQRLKSRSWIDVREEAFHHLEEEGKETVRMINKYGNKSRWYDEKYIYRNRSALKSYLKKELERDGDFGLTHHKVDLFEETDWVY